MDGRVQKSPTVQTLLNSGPAPTACPGSSRFLLASVQEGSPVSPAAQRPEPRRTPGQKRLGVPKNVPTASHPYRPVSNVRFPVAPEGT